MTGIRPTCRQLKPVTHGPKRQSSAPLEFCGRSPLCGHSLQVRNLGFIELTHRGQSRPWIFHLRWRSIALHARHLFRRIAPDVTEAAVHSHQKSPNRNCPFAALGTNQSGADGAPRIFARLQVKRRLGCSAIIISEIYIDKILFCL